MLFDDMPTLQVALDLASMGEGRHLAPGVNSGVSARCILCSGLKPTDAERHKRRLQPIEQPWLTATRFSRSRLGRFGVPPRRVSAPATILQWVSRSQRSQPRKKRSIAPVSRPIQFSARDASRDTSRRRGMDDVRFDALSTQPARQPQPSWPDSKATAMRDVGAAPLGHLRASAL